MSDKIEGQQVEQKGGTETPRSKIHEEGRPDTLLKTGTADLNIVAPAWGCPALAYGPGDSTLDHTPDEHLSLEEYKQAVEVIQNVLKKLSFEE